MVLIFRHRKMWLEKMQEVRLESKYIFIDSIDNIGQSIPFYLVFGITWDEHYFSESKALCVQTPFLDLGIF